MGTARGRRRLRLRPMNPVAARALFDSAVTRLDARTLASRGWAVHCKTFPLLDLSFRSTELQELRVRLRCDDWNDSPPSVELLAPGGDLLAALPAQRPGSSIFNPGRHPSTDRPFVCMAGVREYHTHPSHVGDLWSVRKSQDAFLLGGIITQLWRGWQRFWPCV